MLISECGCTGSVTIVVFLHLVTAEADGRPDPERHDSSSFHDSLE